MAAILRDSPAPASCTRADLPEELQRAIETCLRKDPAERFQTARDLQGALQALRAGMTARHTRAGPRRAFLRAAGIAGAAAVAVAAIGLFLAQRGGGRGRFTEPDASDRSVAVLPSST
jgi:hypothetical protein